MEGLGGDSGGKLEGDRKRSRREGVTDVGADEEKEVSAERQGGGRDDSDVDVDEESEAWSDDDVGASEVEDSGSGESEEEGEGGGAMGDGGSSSDSYYKVRAVKHFAMPLLGFGLMYTHISHPPPSKKNTTCSPFPLTLSC